MSDHPPWFVYIVECSDGSFYTGTAINVEHRVLTHNSGKGAKYTRARKPVRLVYKEEHVNQSLACQREAAIKKLSRVEKEKLIFLHL